MSLKFSGIVIFFEEIVQLLLHNLHDWTFKLNSSYTILQKILSLKITDGSHWTKQILCFLQHLTLFHFISFLNDRNTWSLEDNHKLENKTADKFILATPFTFILCQTIKFIESLILNHSFPMHNIWSLWVFSGLMIHC